MRTGKINQSTSGLLNAGTWQLVEEKNITGTYSRIVVAQNTYSGSSDIVGYYSGTGIHYTCGQGINLAATDIVDRIEIALTTVGSPTGNFTVRIETDSAGLPSGTLVNVNATISIAASSLTTGMNTFTFATPFSLTGSTQYHVVMILDVQSHDVSHYVQVEYSYGTDRYAGGTFERRADAGAWSGGGYATYDLKFTLYSSSQLRGETSYTFSNLNGDVDQEYRIIARIVTGPGGGGNEYVRCNNDSGANYGAQRLTGSNTTASANRDTDFTGLFFINGNTASDVNFGDLVIHAKSGYIRTAINRSTNRIAGTTVTNVLTSGDSWNNTSDNITSLVIVSAAAYGLGIGTHLFLFKRNLLGTEATSGIKTGDLNVQGKVTAGEFQLVEKYEVTVAYMAALGDIDNEDMADITDWTDADASGGDSSQVTFDGKSCMKLDSGGTLGGYAERNQDIGAFTGRTIFSFSIYFDAIGTRAGTDFLDLNIFEASTRLRAAFASDGLFVYDGASWNEVGTDLIVQDVWQKWTFDVNWITQRVDIYLDDILKASAVDCSYAGGGQPNGYVGFDMYGYATTNKIVYIDWFKASSVGISSYTLSGLDGDTDILYEIRIRGIGGYNGASNFYEMRFNNDSGTNYGTQALSGQGTTAAAFRYTNNAAVYFTNYGQPLNSLAIISSLIYAKSGYVRTTLGSSSNNIITTTITSLELSGDSWNNTSSNITSLVILASQTGGLGIGTVIELWALRKKL